MIDVKPLFQWVQSNGEAKAIQRVLIKSIIHIKRFNISLTAQTIEESASLEVPEELYSILLDEAEKVVGVKYSGDNQ